MSDLNRSTDRQGIHIYNGDRHSPIPYYITKANNEQCESMNH